MRRVHNRPLVGAIILVVSAVLTVTWASAGWRKTREASIHGRYSRAQMVTMAQILCRRLEPSYNPEAFIADYNQVLSPYRNGHAEWTVQCLKTAGTEEDVPAPNIQLRWDAVTGKLIGVTRKVVADDVRGREIEPIEASQRAEKWLRLLGMVDRTEQVRFVQPPARNDRAWVMRFSTAAHRGVVRVGRTDDTLHAAMIL